MKREHELKKKIYGDCQKAMMPALILYTLSAFLGGLLSVYTASVLGEFADAVFDLNLSYGISNFWKLLISIGISLLVVPLLDLMGEVLMFKYALVHDRYVLGRFLDKKYEDVIKIKEGEVQYRLEQDIIDFRVFWVGIMERVITIPLMLVYLLYSALRINPVLTVVVFVVSLLKITVPMAVKKLQARYDNEKREYNTQVRSNEMEIIGKPHVVKMFGLSEALLKKQDDLFDEYYWKVLTRSETCNAIADAVLSFLNTFCTLVILFIGALMASKGIITAGAVAAMVGYFSVFNSIIDKMDYIIRKVPLLKNLEKRIEMFYEGAEDLAGKEMDDVTDIKACNLFFAFEEKTVFQNLNFSLKQGSKTAICGTNGSGKSTFLKILCGLLKGYKGRLTLNGQELREVSIESWRRQFAYAMQDPYLFEGSVQENISLGNPKADENRIKTLMEQLGIGDLADRQVSMSQNDLSGGEKQKISIARALLKDTEYLILDEPGNHLDAESLDWLKKFILESRKTILFVTHDAELVNAAEQSVEL